MEKFVNLVGVWQDLFISCRMHFTASKNSIQNQRYDCLKIPDKFNRMYNVTVQLSTRDARATLEPSTFARANSRAHSDALPACLCSVQYMIPLLYISRFISARGSKSRHGYYTVTDTFLTYTRQNKADF